jgi:hypothetical protein
MDKDLRVEALRFLKEWSAWMVGVETAIFGFLVTLLTRDQIALGSIYIKAAAVCFGASMAFTAWSLGLIPSICERLDRDTSGIYSMRPFNAPTLQWMRLGWVAFMQYVFFFLGLFSIILSLLYKQIG